MENKTIAIRTHRFFFFWIFSFLGQLPKLHQSAGEDVGRPSPGLRYELVQTPVPGIRYRGTTRIGFWYFVETIKIAQYVIITVVMFCVFSPVTMCWTKRVLAKPCVRTIQNTTVPSRMSVSVDGKRFCTGKKRVRFARFRRFFFFFFYCHFYRFNYESCR